MSEEIPIGRDDIAGETVEILDTGPVLTNADGTKWVRIRLRVQWNDAKSETGVVTETRVTVPYNEGRTFSAIRREAMKQLPGVLRRAANLADDFVLE